MESKGSGEPKESSKSKLEKALLSVFPKMKPEPRDKPLNLILPAYETLRRVVLSCFIEVTFRPRAKPEWRSELTRFLDNPTKESFDEVRCEAQSTPVSAAFIVNEALRLYPSTKSVYQHFKMDNQDHDEIVVADIERCHRRTELCGTDAESFDPSRWDGKRAVAQAAFMPFGYSPFLCPAKLEYGPMMIGMLVATLSIHLPPEDWTLTLYPHGAKVGHELTGGEALVSDRKTYERMEIVRKSSQAGRIALEVAGVFGKA